MSAEIVEEGSPPNYHILPPPVDASFDEFPLIAVGAGPHVHVGKAVPDKLMLSGVLDGTCFDLPNIENEAVESALVAMTGRVRHFQNKKKWDIRKAKYLRYHFKPLLSSFRVVLGERKRSAKIEFRREYKKGKCFRMRVEFNPRKLGANGVMALRYFLEDLEAQGFSSSLWLSRAHVSALDVAINCIGVRVSDLVVQAPGGTNRNFFNYDGRLETEYVNKPWKNSKVADRPKSDRLVRVYDRRQKLMDQGKSPPYGDLPVTRIEISPMMLGKKMTLSELVHAPSQISKVRVGTVNAMANELGEGFRQWADIARLHGSNYASARLSLSKEVATKFDKAWCAVEVLLFDPSKVWSSWKGECEALKLHQLSLLH